MNVNSCRRCGKDVATSIKDSNYVSIMHMNNEKFRTDYFHTACFIEIAGHQYLPKEVPRKFSPEDLKK